MEESEGGRGEKEIEVESERVGRSLLRAQVIRIFMFLADRLLYFTAVLISHCKNIQEF